MCYLWSNTSHSLLRKTNKQKNFLCEIKRMTLNFKNTRCAENDSDVLMVQNGRETVMLTQELSFALFWGWQSNHPHCQWVWIRCARHSLEKTATGLYLLVPEMGIFNSPQWCCVNSLALIPLCPLRQGFDLWWGVMDPMSPSRQFVSSKIKILWILLSDQREVQILKNGLS